MRTRLLLCSALLASSFAGALACGKKMPPKEPTITETVSDAGADSSTAAEPPKPKSLYERLGGKDGIGNVVDSFLANVTKDPVVKKRFAKLSKERVQKFRDRLVAQICKESGGDCEYTGTTMKEAHKGMKLTDAEWNATVSALKAALDENKVADNEQNDLIAAIAPMKDDIVEVKAKPKK